MRTARRERTQEAGGGLSPPENEGKSWTPRRSAELLGRRLENAAPDGRGPSRLRRSGLEGPRQTIRATRWLEDPRI